MPVFDVTAIAVGHGAVTVGLPDIAGALRLRQRGADLLLTTTTRAASPAGARAFLLREADRLFRVAGRPTPAWTSITCRAR